MKDEQSASTEVVIKEYPHYTRWLEGRQVIGVGNLILTTERLIFLHQVALTEKKIEHVRKLSGEASISRSIDFALTLHKKNFQVPLSSVTLVKTGLYSPLPFPRPCLRIFYISGKRRKKTKTASFMFTIPLLKGFFQFEITTVKSWVRIIEKAVRHKQLAT